jgi:DNA-3-methyladenine glycosylase
LADGDRLGRAFFARDPLEVAPELLGKVLVAGERSGRIVEVEAYRGADDPGSHGYRGVTPRTEVMFGPPGHLYVYFTYGLHWCANVVCADAGTCGAVLIRALAPLTGVEAMYHARPTARRGRDLCSGPAKLCQALGIDGRHDGLDLVNAERGVELRDDGAVFSPARSQRIGLSSGKGEGLPWRFYVPGDPNVSGSPR